MIKLVKLNTKFKTMMVNSGSDLTEINTDRSRKVFISATGEDQEVVAKAMIKLAENGVSNIELETPNSIAEKINGNEISETDFVIFINPFKYNNRHQFNAKMARILDRDSRIFLCMSEEYPEDIKNSFEISEAV